MCHVMNWQEMHLWVVEAICTLAATWNQSCCYASKKSWPILTLPASRSWKARAMGRCRPSVGEGPLQQQNKRLGELSQEGSEGSTGAARLAQSKTRLEPAAATRKVDAPQLYSRCSQTFWTQKSFHSKKCWDLKMLFYMSYIYRYLL